MIAHVNTCLGGQQGCRPGRELREQVGAQCVPSAAAGGSCGGAGGFKSYADALRQPASPAPAPAPARRPAATTKPLGKPKVVLPLSQLTWGRTTPPWNARAWKTEACKVVDGVLRVRYPKGSGTFQSRGPAGGCNFRSQPHCLPAADVTLAYRVRFADNFQWSSGGKLPGLFIGRGSASGGDHSADGASCRLMWLERGKVVAYVYVPRGAKQSAEYLREAKRNTRYGDSLFHAAQLVLRKGADEWNDIVLRVKLNGFEDGAPRADGTLTISVNGRAATVGGVVWRRRPEVKVEHIAVTTFFGGSWKSPVDTYAEFTDFSVVA